ncbi:MAG: hypothetical protein WCA20_32670 [Candidatus Sulfotelmatobacter sp.]
MQTPLLVLEKMCSISLPVAPDSSLRKLGGTQPTSYRLRPHAKLFSDRELGVPLTPELHHGQVLLVSCLAASLPARFDQRDDVSPSHPVRSTAKNTNPRNRDHHNVTPHGGGSAAKGKTIRPGTYQLHRTPLPHRNANDRDSAPVPREAGSNAPVDGFDLCAPSSAKTTTQGTVL